MKKIKYVSSEAQQIIERRFSFSLGSVAKYFSWRDLSEGHVGDSDTTHCIFNVDNGNPIGFFRRIYICSICGCRICR